ncbi:MAG: PKD domain-containing protein [Cyclobacteriaceae bacterium]
MKIIKFPLIIAVITWLVGCGDADFPVPQASTVVASFSYTSLNDNFAPDNIQFTNTSVLLEEGGDAIYTWNFGDGTISNEKDPEHTFENPGTYNVKLVVVNNDQLSETTQSILIKDPNALLVRLFYFDESQKSIREVNGSSFTTQGGGFGVEYDPESGAVYYSDLDNGSVWKTDITGSNHELIIDNLNSPQDIALDAANNLLWVVERTSSSIVQVNLTNKTSSTLYNIANGLGELPIAIDHFEDNLYITCVEIDFESVWVAKKDGSEIKNIIDYGTGGYGYGLAIDKVNRKIYFDNRDAFEILTSNLDGTGINKFADTNGRVYGIAIDNTNGKVYWSDNGDRAIRMANLDGTDVVDVALNLNSNYGLFFIEP